VGDGVHLVPPSDGDRPGAESGGVGGRGQDVRGAIAAGGEDGIAVNEAAE
jgi:hypothetical protein